MSLFGINKKKVVVNFIDLDSNSAEIATSGELSGDKGRMIDYSSHDQIAKLVEQGYELVENKFDQKSTPSFGDEDRKEYVISFKHKIIKISKPNKEYKVTEDELEKKGTEIVHYTGAASHTPQDSRSQVVFKRAILLDLVTGETKGMPWQPARQQFMLLATPPVPGYVTKQLYEGGESVSADDCDREYNVQYQLNRKPTINEQKAVIRYVDLSNGNKEIASDTVTGQPNAVIDYDTRKKLAKLKNKGYILVDNGYNPDGEIQFFSNSDDYVPVFIMTMTQPIAKVDKDHPNKLVDQKEYIKQIKFTVHYQGAGDLTPKDDVQTITLTRSVGVNAVTGKVLTDSSYTSSWSGDQDKFKNVIVPVIAGYHADQKIVKGLKSEISLENTVTYQPNGRIIPVDLAGNEIKNVKQPIYKTNGDDPTKVEGNIVLPKIAGYECDQITVTPKDPGKDTKVIYKSTANDMLIINSDKSAPKDEPVQKIAKEQIVNKPTELPKDEKAVDEVRAVINFIDLDQNGKQLTSSGILSGKPGESINDLYSTDVPLKVIKQAGYRIVFNNYDVPGVTQRFGNNKVMIQIFTIGLTRKKDSEANAADSDKNTEN